MKIGYGLTIEKSGTSEDIVLDRVSKSFDEKEVLRDFCGIVRSGECTGIMGRSGSGKTTLLRLLMGLEKPDGGTISGCPQRIAAVFQEDRLSEGFSALDNVRAALGKGARKQEIEENLRQAGLEGSIHLPVRELSGGMKRRVAIVRACMAESELVILDEPFRGLDHATRAWMAEYVRKMTAGKTVVMATHEEEELRLMGSTRKLVV